MTKSLKVLDKQLADLMKVGLERFIKAQKGQRLDKRSVTAGYYAAAAIFASDSDEVWLFGSKRSRWVKFVMDNDVDVISDYHLALEGSLAKANALAIALEG